MKKITIMALSLFLCGSVFAITFPEHEGSVKVHKKLTAKVFEMLRNGKYAQAKKFLESIPQCPEGTIKKSQIPAYCASSKLNYEHFTGWLDYVVNVESDTEPGVVLRDYKLNTVAPNVILYDAIRTHYRYLAGNNPDEPGAFNKKKSIQLYNTYKDNAWLEPLVKSFVLFFWPRAGEQYTTFTSQLGAELYDRVALAQALNFKIDDALNNYTLFCYSISETEQMLDAVSRRAQEANDNKPVVAIKRKIFEDILDPKKYVLERDGCCTSFALQTYTSALGAEQEKQATHAWKVLAAKPFTQTMKKNAPKLYLFCLANKDGYGRGRRSRKTMKKIWCDNFAKNALKYGLLEPKVSATAVRSMVRGNIRSNSNGNSRPNK